MPEIMVIYVFGLPGRHFTLVYPILKFTPKEASSIRSKRTLTMKILNFDMRRPLEIAWERVNLPSAVDSHKPGIVDICDA